ncbi:MAG TPA: hypothetical protein VNL92_01990, partial [Dehalococcoidia bacterium]|nr:hypothetical protein [Dehalococcoidia bacterium]
MATARERAGGAETRTLASSGLPRDLQGLTWRDARARAERGLANVDTSQLPANGDVVRRNVLTLFNIILGSLILALFALAVADRDVGHFQDGIFVGVIVAANVAVATFQEIRATNRLRQLRALTVPRATVVRDGED